MSDKTLLIPPGALISDALRESGFALDYECGGRGVCGRCRVEVVDPDGTRRSVLACQTRAGGVPLRVDRARSVRPVARETSAQTIVVVPKSTAKPHLPRRSSRVGRAPCANAASSGA